MIYADADLDTLERNAWQRGDYAQAQAFALAIDAEGDRLEADEMRDKLDRIDALITETNWRTGKKAELREMGDAIYSILKEGR